MDKRETMGTDKNFTTMLQELLASGQKASMLVDHEGLGRMEGVIAKLEPPYVELQSGERIAMDTIMAINGVFKDDFSTC